MMMQTNPPIQSRKKTFQFQPDANLIEHNPLQFEQRREFGEHLRPEQLANYIMAEAQRNKEERQNDVSKTSTECPYKRAARPIPF